MGLLVLAALFAGVTLVLRHRIETSREAILDSMSSRTGARLNIGSVAVRGLRGLQLQDFDVSWTTPEGPEVSVHVPEAVVAIDLADLFSGNVTIERIQVDGARVRIARRADTPWLKPSDIRVRRPSAASKIRPFRIVGNDCALEIANLAGGVGLLLDDVSIDAARLEDADDVSARVRARFASSDEKRVAMDIRFTSAEDFNLRLQCSEITAEDVNAYLPPEKQYVPTGSAQPTIRIDGHPGQRLVISIESRIQNLTVRNQPGFLVPVDGALTILGGYNIPARELNLNVAKVDTPQFEGDAEGRIQFSEGPAQFDLRLKMSRLPVEYLVAYALQGRVDEYGTLDFTLQEPHEALVSLMGTAQEPQIAAAISAAGGDLSFAPAKPKWPKAVLRFGRMEASWTPESRGGSFAIVDGNVASDTLGVAAERFSGTLRVDKDQFVLEPLNFSLKDQAFTGSLNYDLNARSGTASLAGTLTEMENTPLGKAIPRTDVAGSLTIKSAKVSFSPKAITFESDLDATQADIAYDWWLRKAPGIGASGPLRTEITLGKSIKLTSDANVGGSILHIESNYSRQKDRWRTESSVFTSESLDVAAASKFLSLPYQITGGTVTEGRYEWTRDKSGKYRSISKSTCAIDELTFQAQGAAQPCRLKGVVLETVMNNAPNNEAENPSTGEMKVHVDDADMPSLKEKWFVPLDNKKNEDEQESPPRTWSYALSAKGITVPPWKGTDFSGDAYTSLSDSGFRTYKAQIDGGTVEGSYRSIKAENAYETTSRWADIPASYLLDHMQFPQVLSGKMTGEVNYSRDRDNPNTLKGKGYFELHDGQFSADFLLAQFQNQLEGGMTALPPSAKIGRLYADIDFEKDLVKTPKVELVSEGIRINAAGQFVTDGDMDYDLKIAISPETAERIPALKQNFNIEGHRLTQQDIELTFKVTGPTLNPKGKIAELPPAHVTLTSGVAGMTSEAIKMIDTPRKILVDLLKLGGGIVATTKKPAGETGGAKK